MGILDWFGVGKEIAKPIEAIGSLYTTDKERLEGEAKLEEIQQKPILAQLANNGIMASASGFFNNGWQPMIGWTAGFLILIYYAPQILIVTYVWGMKCVSSGDITPFPMKPDNLLNLVGLLFGLGAYSLAKKKSIS